MPIPHHRRQLVDPVGGLVVFEEAQPTTTTAITTTTPTATVTSIPVFLINMAPEDYPSRLVIKSVTVPPAAAAMNEHPQVSGTSTVSGTGSGNPFDMPNQTPGQTATVWVIAAALLGFFFVLIGIEVWLKSRERFYAFWRPRYKRWAATLKRKVARKPQPQPQSVTAAMEEGNGLSVPPVSVSSAPGFGFGVPVEGKGKGKEVVTVTIPKPELTAAVARLAER
ncbi:hypothetical protein B0T22DRAFT_514080 [Podospora appendiculata]|uniref:Uncharacterized protein n=1 Tax=Podospora appendiculata TaxID=314037 RepID=A0AAE1CDG0_9PEZI|nr:hypothetical protein B0T22DRAFT_514080 [Podospora appendiculata]